MLKRTNKVAALLVAATSVASLAPAGVSAADYKRIDSQDATVYDAVAFKDGSYVIDGDVVNEDDDAVYYVKDGKYTELEDVDTGSDLKLYGDHYLNVDNGDYFIDLNTGKVTDDDIADDNIDDLRTTLRKELKNVDRYDLDNLPEVNDTDKLPGNNYGELWYRVSGDNISFADDTNNGVLSIYTDLEGNYIDANYNLGRIKVVTSCQGVKSDTAIVENTDDKVDAAGKSEVYATVAPVTTIGTDGVIGQDDKNIYRVAKITVKVDTTKESSAVINSINGIDVDNNIFDGDNTNGYTFTVIQKISKAQASEKIDDAYYAKSVTNYIPCDEDKAAYGEDSDSFYGMINNGAQFTVAGGNLIAYKVDKDDNSSDTGKSVKVIATKLKTKASFNYLDDEDPSKEDIDAIDTDSNGNLYRLDNGYVYEFDNTDDWNKLYRVDGSMDEFSVYDSNNMVVWNEDDEVYSLIGSNASNNDEDNNEDNNNTDNNTPAVTAGWNQASNGTWTYVNADGTTVKGWFQSPLSGKWFYMDPSTGVMQTGWVQSPYSGKWFFMDLTNGDMQTGWVQSPYSGKWFYMNPSNGDMMTGWIQSPYSGKWYYMGSDGAMLTNTTVNGYVLGADGAWVR